MKNAVTIGIEFEQRIEKILNQCGLSACRTNKTNPHDPENFKHGFDGGVDIIAEFKHELREYTFYIQCKCHAKGIHLTLIR